MRFLRKLGMEKGVYMLPILLLPCIFYPEYPENPRTIGETIRKVRTDRGLMIRELAEFVGTNETTVINWELRGRRPEERFHGSLKQMLDIDAEPESLK